MKRHLALAICAAVTMACGQKPADSTTSTPPAQTAEKPAAAAAPAQPATPAAPAKVEITEALVSKYIEYQKVQLDLIAQYYQASMKNLESAKGDVAKTLNQIAINDEISKKLDAELATRRAALGIGDAEFEAVKDAVEIMAYGRLMYNQMGGDAQLAKMEAEFKKQIATLPADQRPAAEAQMKDMTRSLVDMRDGADIRRKYGDASADAVLKFAEVLAKQRLDVLSKMTANK